MPLLYRCVYHFLLTSKWRFFLFVRSLIYSGFSALIIFTVLNNDYRNTLLITIIFILILEALNLITDLKSKITMYRNLDYRLKRLGHRINMAQGQPSDISKDELQSLKFKIDSLEENAENLLAIFQSSIAIIGILLVIGIAISSWLIGSR